VGKKKKNSSLLFLNLHSWETTLTSKALKDWSIFRFLIETENLIFACLTMKSMNFSREKSSGSSQNFENIFFIWTQYSPFKRIKRNNMNKETLKEILFKTFDLHSLNQNPKDWKDCEFYKIDLIWILYKLSRKTTPIFLWNRKNSFYSIFSPSCLTVLVNNFILHGFHLSRFRFKLWVFFCKR